MTANDIKKINTLITFFMRQYEEKFDRKVIVNRNKLKYGLEPILTDLSFDELKDLIAYYVRIEAEPDLNSFCYEYDEVLRKKNEEANDKMDRRKLMSETQARVREFREKYGR